jgi:hypothetical protein
MNRREKLQVFNKLRGISHAEADLALLEDVNPRHAKLTRFSRDPKRYADEILYALLDECDGADIVDHRIYFEKLNENANDASSKTLTGAEQNPIGGSSNTLTDDGQDPPGASSNTLTGETPDDKPSDEETPDDNPSDEETPDDNPSDEETPDDNPSDEEVPDNTSSDEEENVAGQEVDDSKKK